MFIHVKVKNLCSFNNLIASILLWNCSDASISNACMSKTCAILDKWSLASSGGGVDGGSSCAVGSFFSHVGINNFK